jgi:hypothetical protein
MHFRWTGKNILDKTDMFNQRKNYEKGLSNEMVYRKKLLLNAPYVSLRSASVFMLTYCKYMHNAY